MRRAVTALPLLALAGLAAACSGESAARPPAPSTARPSPTQSPSSVSTSPTPDPVEGLTARAKAAAAAHYAATYALRSTASTAAPSTVQVDLAVGASRVALSGNGHTAVFLQSRKGSVACEVKGASSTCVQLAGHGKPVPADLDPGLEHVFLDYPAALAAHAASYTVAAVDPPAPAPAAVTVGDCYRIAPRSGDATVAAGTYCFDDAGVVTEVAYPSGTLVLQKLRPAPGPARLTPPASPQPLP